MVFGGDNFTDGSLSSSRHVRVVSRLGLVLKFQDRQRKQGQERCWRVSLVSLCQQFYSDDFLFSIVLVTLALFLQLRRY